ncbi:hypothetical protein INR79_05370 [Vibrio sp. SCSIO 43132]|uniref:hypothetical protein n=1 Tax=Vibrio sp. SCSIO 43132 TaxID=2779363 RepID=UPI001CA98E97|nr:hypothetical protein [Vibrio sp. SCSIO 43132]UAB71338.1 hypothetical protein INR79_05370 [Vibrio sp. SCSIO 43132]
MVVNPIDTYTEPTFTNSAKGLLSLFAIGFIHQTIGFTLVGNTIEIPGLPKVELQHLDNWSYVYITALIYATYRYFLYNKAQISLLLGKALSEGLRNGWIGKLFVRLTLLKIRKPYHVTHVPFNEKKNTSNEPPNSIRITSYSGDDYASEWLYICLGDSLLPQAIVSIVNLHDGVSQKALGPIPSFLLWGKFRHEEQSHDEMLKTERLASYNLRWTKVVCFLPLGIFYCIKLLTYSPRAFDVFLPLVLSLGMLLHLFIPIPTLIEALNIYIINLLE